MKLLKTIKKTREFVNEQKKMKRTIGFVPTMGYLHQGHLSLIKKAKIDTDCVIASIYVNPTQFGPKEDLKKYPRDLRRDMKLAKSVGVDAIFYPDNKEMYPKGFSTFVNVERLSGVLCGKSRPAHFRGVATIVAKLFNIVEPDIAYFGQKDAQQAIIIKRMREDLNMNLKIKVLPIIREKDGLAMSSRNKYLDNIGRSDAICLFLALQKAKGLIKLGVRDPKIIIGSMQSLIKKRKTAKIDYIEIVDASTLLSINPERSRRMDASTLLSINPERSRRMDAENLQMSKKIRGKILIALAVRIGKTRLIDNCLTAVRQAL